MLDHTLGSLKISEGFKHPVLFETTRYLDGLYRLCTAYELLYTAYSWMEAVPDPSSITLQV
jgi:hypothetical protein